MSELAHSQNQAPQVLGAVTAEEAQLLHDNDPQSAESQAILSRFDQTGEGNTFAVVLSEDDKGESFATDYVYVGADDVGTRIKQENYAAHGLDDPSKAYAGLLAKQAKETEDAQAEQASDIFDAILADDSKLLEASTLHAVITDPMKLLPESALGDSEKLSTLGAMHDYAKQNIVAPEAAAIISGQLVERTAEGVQEKIARTEQTLASIEDDASSVKRIGGNLKEELMQVKRSIGGLRDQLQNPRFMEQDQARSYARALTNFSDSYARLMAARNEVLSKGIEDAGRTHHGVQEGSTDAQTNAIAHRNLTDEAFSNPTDVHPDEVVQAVAKRGAQDINEHKNGAMQDVSRDRDGLRDTVRTFEEAEDATRRLSTVFRQWEGDKSFPHAGHIEPLTDGINRSLSMVLEGNSSGRHMLDDMLQQLQGRVRQIEQAGETDAQNVSHVHRYVTEVRQAMRKIAKK